MTKSIDSYSSETIRNAREFIDAIGVASQNIKLAAEIAARAYDQDAKFIEATCALLPEDSIADEDIIRRFVDVGRGLMDARLLFANGATTRKLRALNDAVAQAQYLDNGVPLLVKSDFGWETKFTKVEDLTAAQRRQVFGPEGIRSEAAQRNYLDDLIIKQSTPPPKPVPDVPYRAERKLGQLVVLKLPCALGIRELAEAIAALAEDDVIKRLAETIATSNGMKRAGRSMLRGSARSGARP